MVTSAPGLPVVRSGRLRADATGGIGAVRFGGGVPLSDTSGRVRLRYARSTLGRVVLAMERAVPQAVPLGQVRRAWCAVPYGLCSPCLARRERMNRILSPVLCGLVSATRLLTPGTEE